MWSTAVCLLVWLWVASLVQSYLIKGVLGVDIAITSSFAPNQECQAPVHPRSKYQSQDLTHGETLSSRDLTCRCWILQEPGCPGLSCPYVHEWTGELSPPLFPTCSEWLKGTCKKRPEKCLYAHYEITPTSKPRTPTAPRAMRGLGKSVAFPIYF